jgi:hypothetical protein
MKKLPIKDIQGRAREAGLEFAARELRLHHPDGRFDEGGRFYPSQKEEPQGSGDPY